MEESFDKEISGLPVEVDEQKLPSVFDPLKLYLAEISKYAVLSREEEKKLAIRVYKYKDKEAAQKLVMANLRLVVKIALEYYNAYQNILDLIQEGNIGLLHAVKKYNPYKGTKFSTYASFWIRAYILKHIMNSFSLVKVGTTQAQRKLFYKLNREKRKLEGLGIFVTPKLLADSLDVTPEEVQDMEKRLSYTDIYLDAPISDEGEDKMVDFVRSEENIEEKVEEKEKSEILSRKIEEFKAILNEKELFVFERRILADEPMTLQEIGDILSISRERVRQIENNVLKKLRERFTGELRELSL